MKWMIVGFLSVLLTGCFPKSQTIIDWVDFVKFNDTTYTSNYSKELSSENDLGVVVSVVQFKLDGNITSSLYKTKNGDASYREKGTKIYEVKGAEGVYAVKDSKNKINGYQIYEESGNHRFENVVQSDILKIEIHEILSEGGERFIKKLENKTDIQAFLSLLNNSEETLDFEPNYENQDPTHFQVLFYHDGPLVDRYTIVFDGTTYYWYPFDAAVLTEEMANYLQ